MVRYTEGWSVKQSKQMKFVATEDLDELVLGVAKDGNIEVVLDLETGRERFIGRVPPPARSDEGAS